MAVEQIILDIRAQVADANKRIKQLEGRVKGVNKEVKQTDKLFAKAGATLAAFFSVQAIAGFTKQVIAVRAEFEKYEAVLKNTLGTAKAAQKEFDMIREFAAQTPFQVIELTNSFVKLVNQGFKPTIQEMRRLGDLAASTGKSFDQLAEAIIDATVGEFERLKEFGIRAQKAGDQVKFTFKEVETQVKFTSNAIRQYILSLGDVVGVSGAMAGISETLGGKISNLGDAWDSLLNTMGERTTGVFSKVISMLKDMIETIELGLTEDQSVLDVATQRFDKFTESLGGVDAEQARQRFVDEIQFLEGRIQELGVTNSELGDKWIKTWDDKIQFDQNVTLMKIFREELDLLEKGINDFIVSGEERFTTGGAEEDEIPVLEQWMFGSKGIKGTVGVLEAGFDEAIAALEARREKWNEDRDKDSSDEILRLERVNKEREKLLQEQLEQEQLVADAMVQIELWKQDTKIFATQAGFSALMDITSENATAQKILAIAESIISTYLTAQYAAQSQAAIPIVGPILAEAARATAITTGWINTALIAGVAIAESFEEGGFTGSSKYGFKDAKGKRIAGVVHENEFVFPERMTKELRPFFDDLYTGKIDARGLAALTKRGVIMPLIKNEFNSEVLEREVSRIYSKIAEERPKRYIENTPDGVRKVIGNTTINIRN